MSAITFFHRLKKLSTYLSNLIFYLNLFNELFYLKQHLLIFVCVILYTIGNQLLFYSVIVYIIIT